MKRKMFDFDNFINRTCIGETTADGKALEGIFGKKALYIPDNNEIEPFAIAIDFHKAYKEVDVKALEISISSTDIAAFIRLCDMPGNYRKILQGDHLLVENQTFDIINVEYHIPGTKKVILHEQDC